MDKIKKGLKNLINKKSFHICVIATIIVLLVACACFITLKYDVEGETKMPFNISKINIISSVKGENAEEQNEKKWNINIDQNNDIYIYIDKNEEYKEEEAIDVIILENFNIEKKSNIGEIKIYKPDEKSEKEMFKNIEENSVEKIEFEGEIESKVKALKISNQGDLIYFRITNKNVSKYSSDDEQINHNELLKKTEVNEENLKIKVSFDIIIKLESGKSYKANLNTELPVEGIVEKGTTLIEITDVNKLIFKRI